jgi:hypothetical protein
MTAWWNVYPSKDKKDMIWADMTWVYIVIYDIWNFAYTYNCLPTHSWFCGIALLLAPAGGETREAHGDMIYEYAYMGMPDPAAHV